MATKSALDRFMKLEKKPAINLWLEKAKKIKPTSEFHVFEDLSFYGVYEKMEEMNLDGKIYRVLDNNYYVLEVENGKK